jgi:hypothetical protein
MKIFSILKRISPNVLPVYEVAEQMRGNLGESLVPLFCPLLDVAASAHYKGFNSEIAASIPEMTCRAYALDSLTS